MKGKTMAAKKKDERTVYVVKARSLYMLFDGDKRVGGTGSRVTAVDTAKELGYGKIEEVTLEQWLALISS